METELSQTTYPAQNLTSGIHTMDLCEQYLPVQAWGQLHCTGVGHGHEIQTLSPIPALYSSHLASAQPAPIVI